MSEVITKEMLEWMRENVPGRLKKDSYKMFCERFGPCITFKQFQIGTKNHGIKCGESTRFIKGKQNGERMKGVRFSKDTEFQKGNRPPNTVEVGTITKRPAGNGKYVYWIKTGPERKDWEALSRYVYRNTYGEIPKDHVIMYANNNQLDCRPENLIAIPMKNRALVNQMKKYASTREDMELINTIATLMIEIKRKKGKKGKKKDEGIGSTESSK